MVNKGCNLDIENFKDLTKIGRFALRIAYKTNNNRYVIIMDIKQLNFINNKRGKKHEY
jgi:hypothetical protein